MSIVILNAKTKLRLNAPGTDLHIEDTDGDTCVLFINEPQATLNVIHTLYWAIKLQWPDRADDTEQDGKPEVPSDD